MSNTSDILAGIESKANWLRQDSQFLADYVGRLTHRRNFETKAEAAMDAAERDLIAALQSVRKSRAAFNAKPVENACAA